VPLAPDSVFGDDLALTGSSASYFTSVEERNSLMAFMILHFETDDYDTWKQMFDSDPAGRREIAKGHSILRGVDNPNEVFVRAEFDSVESAQTFRKRLLDSGALNSQNVRTGPTVVEGVERVDY
jgi:hypothetical protein